MREKFKPIDKKDLPKLIGLVVLAVGAFVFALIQLAPTTSASSAKPKPAPAGTTGSPAAAATAKGDKPDAASDATFVADDIAILTSGKDPFVPNGPAAVTLDPTVAAPKAAPAAKPVSAPSENAAPVVREITPPAPVLPSRFGGRAADAESEAVAKPAMPAPVLPPPAPPAYVVTGVVRGQNPDGSDNIAILRGGGASASSSSGPSVAAATPGSAPAETAAAAAAPTTTSERRFVRAGDAVGNGFLVVAVRRDGVTLAHSGSKSRVTLTLGDNSRAK